MFMQLGSDIARGILALVGLLVMAEISARSWDFFV